MPNGKTVPCLRLRVHTDDWQKLSSQIQTEIEHWGEEDPEAEDMYLDHVFDPRHATLFSDICLSLIVSGVEFEASFGWSEGGE